MLLSFLKGKAQLADRAVISPFKNDVHDTGYCIRTVGGRRSVHQDINTVERECRDDGWIVRIKVIALNGKAHAINHH